MPGERELGPYRRAARDGHPLGAVISEHRAAQRHRVARGAAALLLGAAGAWLLLSASLSPVPNYLAVAILGAMALAIAWGPKRASVTVREGGLVLRQGGSLRQLQWRELRELRQHTHLIIAGDVEVGTRWDAQLTLESGEVVPLNPHVLRPEVAAGAIGAAIAERVLPRARERLAAGEPVMFGTVGLSSEGLVSEDDVLPWSQLRRVRWRGATLEVLGTNAAQPFVSMHQFDIPNYLAFVTLLGEKMKEHGVTTETGFSSILEDFGEIVRGFFSVGDERND